MKFESMADFIGMGGHGLYVWLAYGIALAILLFNVVQPLRQTRQLLNQQARLVRREKGLS
ncbi:heme exporter protein CcmD [Marinobacterium aestuarii]|uniref:Heme exporter protein D n=1 Tax=Marinobacterium aestuarii TaxID=1821621 RepID=A0A1A9F5C4_9GAMM|nr:heme exporter protein CcmD [Marinobacterium aestuarii]ANG65098.1 heme exporter protein CcmD [Marinobacterium aestuarii]